MDSILIITDEPAMVLRRVDAAEQGSPSIFVLKNWRIMDRLDLAPVASESGAGSVNSAHDAGQA